MLSQLSYVPLVAVQSDRIGRTLCLLVGVPRLELGTSALSGLRSNQLSYTPDARHLARHRVRHRKKFDKTGLQWRTRHSKSAPLRVKPV